MSSLCIFAINDTNLITFFIEDVIYGKKEQRTKKNYEEAT